VNVSLTAHRRRVPRVRVLVAAAIAVAVLAAAMPAMRDSRALGATAACTSDSSWPAANASFAQQVVDLVNAHRAALGLVTLSTDPALTDSAVWKARHMAQYLYFTHEDPAPPVARDPFARMAQCGYTQNAAMGENIALGQTSPAAVMTAWLDSPGHKANIENGSYRAIGVGAAAGADGIEWVQDFGSVVGAGNTPPSPPPPPQPAPPPPPPPPAPSPPPAPPAPPKSSTPVLPPATPVVPSSTEPAGAEAQIGAAIAEPGHEPTSVTRKHKRRTTRLRAAKPRAGNTYTVRMSFGRVPVATTALALRCHARLSGKRLKGTGDIAGHVATCTWQIPESAGGGRLVARVKVSGRHGVSLVRSARLIVAR
jgi:uncharacterized protein YkwD